MYRVEVPGCMGSGVRVWELVFRGQDSGFRI
jgi:hypothetical protein